MLGDYINSQDIYLCTYVSINIDKYKIRIYKETQAVWKGYKSVYIYPLYSSFISMHIQYLCEKVNTRYLYIGLYKRIYICIFLHVCIQISYNYLYNILICIFYHPP